MTDYSSSTLEVSRTDPLGDTRVIDEVIPEPRRGEVVLEVERFALSANNLTYALLGDQPPTRYWDVFPSAGVRGRVPAWGSARVIAGDDEIARIGDRFVGVVPMAGRFALRGRRTDVNHLVATGAERAEMLPLYREMRSIDNDATWREHLVGAQLVLRPIHPISALLARSLADGNVLTAVVSSASSKTGLLLGRRLREGGVRTVGLTSPERVAATESTGAFELVLSYPDLLRMPVDGPTAFLDIAGNASFADDVRGRLGTDLVRHIAIGATHYEAPGGDDERTGTSEPVVEPFDTAQAEVDLAERDGLAALRALEDSARDALIPWASRWLQLDEVHGIAAAENAWRALATPAASPLSGTLVLPRRPS